MGSNCWFCDGPCCEDVDEFSLEFDAPLHLACLRRAVATITPGDRETMIFAREFGMTRSAPGRGALECPRGHETIAAGTRYRDGKCKACHALVALAVYRRKRLEREASLAATRPTA